MTKQETHWPALLTLVVACLLIGGFVGALGFSNTTTETIEVEKIVNVPYEVSVPYEVIKEVSAPNILDQALATFLIAVEDEEDEDGTELDLLEGYDFEEVSVSKVYDNYIVSYDDDESIIEFQVKLKYKEDGEKSEKITYDVRVTYETDEDSIIEIL